MHYSRQELQDIRNLRKAIGNNIHHLRRKNKLTLHKCARLSGINPRMLDQYELGKNKIKLEEAFKLAFLFEIGLEELLVGSS